MHRAIAAFTDSHLIVKKSKARLQFKYRHYAGVIVDMFYDHFLATNWYRYHYMSLMDFSEKIYSLLYANQSVLPLRARHLLPYMRNQNWLVNYGTLDGIGRALSGMAGRTTHDSKMGEATFDLTLSYHLFEDEFNLFFPKVKEFCAAWLIENRSL
jgi:acyl carrier protein phosphodiesterase